MTDHEAEEGESDDDDVLCTDPIRWFGVFAPQVPLARCVPSFLVSHCCMVDQRGERQQPNQFTLCVLCVGGAMLVLSPCVAHCTKPLNPMYVCALFRCFSHDSHTCACSCKLAAGAPHGERAGTVGLG